MKQTNNAIKFLMAQYRAIFKHANIAMVAAMAAAALSAGQAQAANFDNAALGTTGDLNVDVDGTTGAGKFEHITLSGGASIDKGFTITVKGGGAADANFIKGDVTLSNASITVAGALIRHRQSLILV